MGSIRSVLTGLWLIRFVREHWRPLAFSVWAIGVLVAYLGQFAGSLDGIRKVLDRIFGGG